MFVPAIKGQGTEEQQQKWLPLGYKMQIIGCYAQIELGHGSNVQGLESTATFDPQTDEFVIHSPTLTSSKITDLLVNITKHVLKPTHRVLYDKEKQNLLKKFSLEDKQIDDVGMDTK